MRCFIFLGLGRMLRGVGIVRVVQATKKETLVALVCYSEGLDKRLVRYDDMRTTEIPC